MSMQEDVKRSFIEAGFGFWAQEELLNLETNYEQKE